ncbi:tRNA pseudouridine(55) synthase TruB [Paenibacillus senegalensis]|uniref:tRNA pseudouridine(55) synthase TruB n=1 Tax=Paenibacillus senegalensis TaxID=1465766 RepID=UPI000289441C|nr:tRNA pseudouridine(55) synthase TruB [Paenibacillus senegalensis]
MSLEGVLPVLKPVDYTSHDVVAKVRRLSGLKRIGHTGTLDPKVTGVLPLCLGRATRVVEYIQDMPKTYEAQLTIGLATDTEDLTGEIIDRCEKVQVTREQIIETLQSFKGTIEQIPPMYSAVKVNGERLYDLARKGKHVDRPSRQVTLYDIELLDIDLEKDYPEIRFRVQCSKGTYIRTLCSDIGKKLGYPAVMSHLVRTSTGSLSLADCLTIDEIEAHCSRGTLGTVLIATDKAIPHIPAVNVTDQLAVHALQGKSISAGGSLADPIDQALYRIYSDANGFLGLFRWDAGSERLVPEKVFN